MFRLRVLQVARFEDNSTINLKIKTERYSTKNKITKDKITKAKIKKKDLKSTETIEAKEVPILQDSSNYTTELSDSSVNCIVPKPAKMNEAKLKVKESSTLLSQSKTDILDAIPKFKIMENLKSFPIFDNEVTKNYGIQCTTSKCDLKIPYVTGILKETMSEKSKADLAKWKNNIVHMFGKTYFECYCEGLLLEGKLFHKCIENVLLKKEVPIEPRIKSVYHSVEPVLKDLQNVYAIETFVVHPTLRYHGYVDCIASDRDGLCIIDWKRSFKEKTSLAATFDAPLQLAAYIGAINASNNYPFKVDRGLLVVAYTSGQPATVHELKDDSLQNSWNKWLERLEQFYKNLNNN
ncbi:Mitochondrial genome maintenance exonuclease 1 [Anthophora retusa]